MAALIRVLLVDDSGVARSMLRSILEEDGGFEVVAEAHNGREAVELACRLRPDLVTMDLEMPVMGGLDAIEEIMAAKAVPILVVSSVADAHKAYTAVARGAIEVINKPSASSADIADFLDKARLVASIPVITHVRVRRAPPLVSTPDVASAIHPTLPAAVTAADVGIVAIASSTGGPQALAQILAQLPADFPCPIVVAQHISDGFAVGLAEWLTTVSPLAVKLGTEGETLAPGVVYLSPSENNMTVTGFRRITLVARAANQVYRPSCDALLTSVAAVYGRRSIGVILTGMGSDGVRGMEAINRVGGVTLAQNESSSVIFGMNAIAIEKGVVQNVLPLDALADAVTEFGRNRATTGRPR
ncbi:chemotaxis-specific protein-glutamate methyltransferase CheB [Telmatospirillum sp.]|uniref:chemotaxis-specific protein-glutamate methyltransferase CheB n=1 Tax=Telmatospirillum sp. TaxID=2079197 RepID=UPI0028503864|nr:chemotaxis-specific protein-glutamate methyltransferase CheB [Telmatospirillum sp.]MDR3437360.1 chemotaxis-specific protein-glutamate methyltransferase CheB [Telmatospirillum sp.]